MRFTIGNVFGTLFSTLGSAFGPLLAVTAILHLGLAIVLFVPNLLLVKSGATSGVGGVWALLMLPLLIVNYLAWVTHWCAVIDIFLRKAANKPIRIGEVLRNGLVNTFPVLLIMVLWLLGLFTGYMLLVVPGTIFAVVFQVTVPAYIGDKPGIFGAFSRSRDLTRGHRWGIFGLMLLINISFWILGWIVVLGGGLAIVAASYGGGGDATSPLAITAAFLFGLIAIPAMMVLLPAINASIYIVLRTDKGDPLSGVAIEKVFE